MRKLALGLPGIQKVVYRFVEENKLEAPVQARLLDPLFEIGEASKEALKATGHGRRPFRARGEQTRPEMAQRTAAARVGRVLPNDRRPS